MFSIYILRLFFLLLTLLINFEKCSFTSEEGRRLHESHFDREISFRETEARRFDWEKPTAASNDAFTTSRTLHFTRSRVSASKLLLSSRSTRPRVAFMSYDLRLIDRPLACTTRKSKHCDRAADANCTMTTTTTRILEAKDKRAYVERRSLSLSLFLRRFFDPRRKI